MISGQLASAAERLRKWAVEQALPLWANAGFDRTHGRFHERLTLAGAPVVDVPVRLVVQARQVYSFAVASRRGWSPIARDLIERAFQSMVREFHRPDNRDGWIFSIDHDGAIVDPKRDLYAHAFTLLAVASYVQASGRREALSVANETLAYIDRDLRAPQGGGYLESAPLADSIRRQNPHMHMFEGLLALWQASGERRYLTRAEEIFELFGTRFFRSEVGVLGEYFDAGLAPAAGSTGEIVEPGHHYEWIWLLRRFERESGLPVQAYVDPLYLHADRYGYDSRGLIVDELLSDGRVRSPSHRVWPVTEAIKANLVEASLGRPGAAAKAVHLAGILCDRFFTREPCGGWIDRLNEEGAAATDFMPATTLYHVICAIDELHRTVSDS